MKLADVIRRKYRKKNGEWVVSEWGVAIKSVWNKDRTTQTGVEFL